MTRAKKDRQRATLTVADSRSTIRTLVQDLMKDPNLGIWSFEMDEGKPPRMYGNKAMDELLGCDGSVLTPEEYYHAWYDHIDPDHYEAVNATVMKMVAGRQAEVQYPFNHPTRGRMMVRCGGHRDRKYAPGLRIVGRHQDVSELLHFEKRSLQVLADERDRADKEQRMAETLELLVAEHDLDSAIEQLIGRWCDDLGAQWFCLGQFRDSHYRVLHSYAAKGEEVLFTAGRDTERLEDFVANQDFHGLRDYLPLPDFQATKVSIDFAHIASNPDAVCNVASFYSHIVRLDGQRWGSITLAFRQRRELTPNEERFFASVARAVETALMRRRFEDRLRAERDRAVVAEKAKSEFLFSVSHDIRTPMHVILGFADIAVRSVDDRETVLDCLRKIKESGELLSSLLNSVLDMSRLEAGKVKLVETAGDMLLSFATIEETMTALAREKRIDLSFSYGEIRDRYVYADFEKSLRIFVNIITNAVRYTKEGGRIRVRCEQAGPAAKGRARYRYTFEDNGVGMSREYMRNLYDRFSREEDPETGDVGGIGIGMAICKAFVDMMGGTITCRSEKNVGTTFVVELPLRVQKGTREFVNPQTGLHERVGQARSARPVSFEGKRILLVDDTKLNREISRHYLVQAGFAVDIAEDGAVAVDLVRKGGPGHYDAILMDIQMPVMDGHEATRQIRQWEREGDFKPVPVIALSANGFDEDRLASLAAGMTDHLAKGVKSEVLVDCLARHL